MESITSYSITMMIDMSLQITIKLSVVQDPDCSYMFRSSWGYYLETDPDPIAMVIRVELFIHRLCQTEEQLFNIVVHEKPCSANMHLSC